ncbi:LLM class flavin-dependent oxidoreductase [Homoserinibacter sp. YIM 151385]|uniref:LLM class flavin-dependent oxidoreductase n=1 Tax=Homoserinibacter sp. YIM 151385 TaxID=2985506 RepID=UPI0022F0713D|nr:LLM class flavin-dependent oxidoreductase [Homoserinibacter sp. YIM 151385]WBU37317.1 LLM class flavin-dependent oxidoreductase [Homoserinibacter sp. YIM 151385]
MSSPRLGFAFVPAAPPERLPSLARAVESAGFDDLWVWEDCFAEAGIAQAAIALASTSRISVGISLLPVPLRTAPLLAMEIATLARAFPGRFLPGIGHGVQEWMGQVGVRAASPLTLLREHAAALRALLDGERVTTDGRYVKLDDVALEWPPVERVPLWIGAGGPKSLALIGELGDGLLIGAAAPTRVIEEAIATARSARPAERGELPVVAALVVAKDDPAAGDAAQRAARDAAKWHPEADETTWAAGSAERIAAGVRGLLAAGVTTVQLQPTGDEPDLEGLVEFLGREVLPLLR